MLNLDIGKAIKIELEVVLHVQEVALLVQEVAQSAAPLALRFSYGNPLKKWFEFLDSKR